MKFTPRQSRSHRVSADMTPMVDIVLQLIIFFMVTSQFSQLVRSEVDLPKEEGRDESVKAPTHIVIDVDEAGSYLIERRQMSDPDLQRMLASAIADHAGDATRVRVLVRADQEVFSGAVDRLALMLRAAGITSWRIGTEQPTGRNGGGGTLEAGG